MSRKIAPYLRQLVEESGRPVAARELRALLAAARSLMALHDEMQFGISDSVDRAVARLRRVSKGTP